MPVDDQLLADVKASPSGPQIGAFFDFDGTVIDGYSIAAFYRHRLRTRDLSLLELTQLLLARLEGDVSEDRFTELASTAAKALAGRSADELDELGERLLVQRIGASLYPEAWELLQTHLRKGHTVAMATAATRFQVEPMARQLGVEHVLCTELEVDDGILTGRLDGAPLWGGGKADAVRKFAAGHGVDLAQSFGYGNGDEDVTFLETVGRPRAVNPQPVLAAVAKERGWPDVRWPDRGRPGPARLARSAGMYAAMATAGYAGLAVGLLNRDRRAGLDVGFAMMGDVSLAVAGVRLDVQGEQNLWERRPAVFMFNHQSGIDVLIAAKLLRRGFSGIAKKEVARVPGLGQAFALADVAFVDRGNTSQAKAAMAPAVDRLRNGISMVIAPEGTRSATPRLGRFKKGGFHLAMQAGVPIVPIVIRNAGDVMWRTSLTVRPGTVDVVVHPPIATDGWTAGQLDRRVAEVRKIFVDTLDNWPGKERA